MKRLYKEFGITVLILVVLGLVIVGEWKEYPLVGVLILVVLGLVIVALRNPQNP